MEGFQFREALAEDKEEILDIDRNVYSGGDYLEKVYDEWAVQVTKSYHSKFYIHVTCHSQASSKKTKDSGRKFLYFITL